MSFSQTDQIESVSTLFSVVPSPREWGMKLGNWGNWEWGMKLGNLWGIKLNASKTETMIVFRSRIIHPGRPH